MAKRLTDTTIWSKDWYLDLPLKKKLLLKYIYDNCDCAGVYEISYRTLKNCFDEEITKEDFEGLKQIKFIDENKILIEDFIKFQYGVTVDKLKPRNSVHRGILRCLEKHELLANPSLTVKDKDKDKDKDKNKDKDKDKNQNKNKVKDKVKNINFDIKNHSDDICFDMNNNPELSKPDKNDIKNHHDKKLKSRYNDLKDKMFKTYEELCPHLIGLSGERNSKRTDEKIRLYLTETKSDMELYKELCQKADKLKTIGTISIDFETMLNCRIGILNGKYKNPKKTEEEKIKERAQNELRRTKELLAEYKNFKGDPMPESFKKLGEKLRSMK